MTEARDVRERGVCAVAVSKDGRWVVTAEGAFGSRHGELRVCEVETGIVKSFSEGHIGTISIDISSDSTLLASASSDGSVWMKNLKTGHTLAVWQSPSSSLYNIGAIRLSQDSKKLAMRSAAAQSLEVWDIQAETCVRRSLVRSLCGIMTNAPMFWTTKDKTIVTALSFNISNCTSTCDLKTIYEFDASTLQTVGAPFEGHTDLVAGLALSIDCALLASAAYDQTIKLWAFESRQLLASFDVQHPRCITFSPDSCQLVYTAWADIHICDISSDILSGILPIQQEEPSTSTSIAETPRLADLPNSNATLHAVQHRKPEILPVRSSASPPRPSPTTHSQQRTFFRYLRNLLPSSSRTDSVPLRNADLCDPLDSRLPTNQSSATAPTTFKARLRHLWTTRTLPPNFGALAPGQLRNDTNEDYIPPSSNSQTLPKGQPMAGEHGHGRLYLCF